MDKELEAAKAKLLNFDELSDEEMQLLQDNFTPEQLDEMLMSSMSKAAPDDVIRVVNENLLNISGYISGMFSTNPNMRNVNPKIINLLNGVQIFISNFNSSLEDMKAGTTDEKWEFRVE